MLRTPSLSSSPHAINRPIRLVAWLAAATAVLLIALSAAAGESQRKLDSNRRPRPPAGKRPLPEPAPNDPADAGPVTDGSHDPYRGKVCAIAWGDTDPALSGLHTRIVVAKRHSPSGVAEETLDVPPGQRVLNLRDFCWGLLDDPRDVCLTPGGHPTNQRGIWPTRGIEKVRGEFERFFSRFAAAGGEVDYVLFDYEVGYQWPSIRSRGNAAITAIQNDPRFPAIADQLGFSNLFAIDGSREKRARWDAVMDGWRSQVMNEAIFEVIHDYFPNAIVSNYHTFIIEQENATPDRAGRMEYRLGPGFGTHDTAKFYGIISRGLARKRLDGSNRFGNSSFAGVLVHINRLRAIRRSTDRPFQPWVVGYSHTESSLGESREFVISGTDHYDDYILQLAVHGTSEIIYWNIKQPRFGVENSHSTHEDDIRFEALLAEMNERLNGEWGEPVSLDPLHWGTKIIATGLHVDDRIVWRVTLADGYKGITARVGGEVQHLMCEPGRRGFWVEHPADQTFTVLQLNRE